MKVIHLISGGDTGGAKTSVITLLEQLNKLMTIKLICLMEAEFSVYAREHEIDVTVMAQKNRWDFSVVPQITKLIDDEKIDLVNCHGARANFIGAFLKKQIKIPIITTVHSDYSHDFDNSFYKKILYTTLNRLSLRSMDGYVAMAQRFKSDMIKRGFKEKRLFVAYNGIPMNFSEPLMSSEEFIRKYRIPFDPKNFYVGTASRLHPIKGVDVLLRAAVRIKNEKSQIKFLVAGTGDEKTTQKYQEFIKNHGLEDTVLLLGYVEEMILFYRLLNINTITSHSEAVCYALLEGGRLKKASIASRVGGTPELIDHQKTGLLIEDNDDKQLAQNIIELFNHPELADRLGNALHQKVSTNFSDVAMAVRYKEIYQEILERKTNEKKI